MTAHDRLEKLAQASFQIGYEVGRVGGKDTVYTPGTEAAHALHQDILTSIPKGEQISSYHDLYSGRGKDWTDGFRTGYDMATNLIKAGLDEYFKGGE